MRCVVRCDRVDGAVGETGLDRRDVVGGAQRRIHLEDRVIAAEVLVGEREVVGRSFCRHGDAVGLGQPDQLDAARRRQVEQVDAGTGQS